VRFSPHKGEGLVEARREEGRSPRQPVERRLVDKVLHPRLQVEGEELAASLGALGVHAASIAWHCGKG
jgi:hypothetical protein